MPRSDADNFAPSGFPVPTPDGRAASVVRALDLATKSLVAPESRSRVTNFTRGAYWSVTYAAGLRLRIMPLYGSARVSAIFFDS